MEFSRGRLLKTFLKKSKYFLILLAGFVLINAQLVRANDELFNNNLLKVDVAKTSLGGVKVTLFTTKPYKDAVIVNQKGNNEYVILMPETSNSLTAKPSLKSASDVLQNIEVKTQQYSAPQGQKGYTKIIITSQAPVEIMAHTQNLNVADAQIKEQEYKELMAQTSKKPAPQVIVPPKKNPPPKPTLAKDRTVKIQPSKVIAPTEPIQKTLKAPTIQKEKIVQKEEPAKIVAQAPTAQTEPLKVIEQSQEPQVQAPVAEEIIPEPTQQPIAPAAISRVQKYKHLIKLHLKEILAVCLATFLLFLLIIKKLANADKNRNLYYKETEANDIKEEEIIPPTESFDEEIDENLNWKEKYQTYVGAKDAKPKQNIQYNLPITEKSEIDDLFSNDLFNDDNLEQDYESKVTEEADGKFEQFEENIPETEEEIPLWMKKADENTETPDANEPEQAVAGEVTLEDFDNIDFGDVSTFSAEESSLISELFDEEPEQEAQEEQEEHGSEMDLDELTALESLDELLEEQIFEQNFDSSLVEKTTIEEDADELIQSKVEIQPNKGFCLVDFEDKTALVGYIDEEIFVIKRFDNIVKGKLQARLNETKGYSSDYLIRVNDFKAMVEVGAENMNCLIEL